MEVNNREASTSNRSLSPAAERMRRHRERRRQRLRCVMVELRETEIIGLVRRGLLHPDARSVPGEIVRREATVPVWRGERGLR